MISIEVLMTTQKLNCIGKNIWEYEYTHNKSLLHVRMRMVVVKLTSGGLWIYSPNPIDTTLQRRLEEIGPIEHLVAPNCFHDLFIIGLISQFPRTTVWGAPGLSSKIGSTKIEELGRESSQWCDTFEFEIIEGMPKMNEVVFFHKLSGTLICADFVFNIRSERHYLMKVIWWLLGVSGDLKQSLGWRVLTRNKNKYRYSIERILNWEIERVVMAHGDILQIDKTMLRKHLKL